METLIWGAIFIASLAVLIKASDYFTDAAEEIGLFFKLPPFLIGVTIVAMGTSLPELISSIFAVFSNSSEMVLGNVVGSNITNIFLILGIAGVVGKKMKLDYEILNVDLPILMSSALILTVVMIDSKVTLLESILCVVGVSIYLFRAVSESGGDKKEEKTLEKDLKKTHHWVNRLPVKSAVTLLVSASFIFVGAKYTVDAAVRISEILEIGKEIIAASVIALGTSLPELTVSLSAAKKGKAEIAVGNILGSNIFNALGVVGITGLFGTLIVPTTILTFGLPLMIIATVMYLFVTQDKEITRWEGYFLILFYVLYIGKILTVF